MTHDVQPADPRLRRRFLTVMVCVAALIALGIRALDAHLLELHVLAETAQPEAAVKAQDLMYKVLAVCFLAAAGLCLVLVRSSWKIIRSERFPAPGTRVLSDTPIRRGRAARRYGQAGLIVATLVLLLTWLITIQANRILEGSLDTRLQPTPVAFD
ncbi:MAG: hypothetical protein AAF560_01070 [Acidobacteriota bacterium]